MSNVDSLSPQGHEYEAKVLDVLKRAVAEALERKRKLGQYAVVWRDGRVVCAWPDAAGAGVRQPGTTRNPASTSANLNAPRSRGLRSSARRVSVGTRLKACSFNAAGTVT